MGTTADLGLPELAQQQANPDVTVNETFALLQAMLKGAVSFGTTAPPGSPVDGDVYILGAVPTGAWAGKANKVAVRVGTSWRFIPGADDSGTDIPIGARHEGLVLWVNNVDQTRRWNGAAWSLSSIAASQVVNTPAGNIAATDVQAALNELDTEKVALTGGTMTGALNFSLGSGTPTFSTVTCTDTSPQLVTVRSDTVNPAVGETIASYVAQGKDSAGNITTFGNIRYSSNVTTDGAERGTIECRTTVNGTVATQWSVILGLFMAGSSGDQGSGTINATAYYVNTRIAVDSNSLIRTRVFTVGTLPAGTDGAEASVSDANATHTAGIGAIVAAGGANHVPVRFDGTNWRIG